MQKSKEFWQLIVKLALKKDVFFNASAITFNLIICAIPFTLLMFSLVGYVLSFEDAFQEIVRYGQEFFPRFSYETGSGDVFQGEETVEALIRPLVQKRQLYGIVGVVILSFFSQGLFHTAKHVVFEIFEFQDRRHPAMELIYNFFTFGLVGGVFIFFSVSISMVSIISYNEIRLPFTDLVLRMNWLYELLNILIPILFTFFLFYTIYRYISEKRLSPQVSMIGALIYTVLFELVRYGVGIYLDYAFRAYKYFYQGYTILLIIGLWAFYSAALFVVATIVARAWRDIILEQPKPSDNPYTAIS